MPTLNLGRIRFNWRGDWTSSTAYAANDVVHYSGDAFVATATTTNVPPRTGAVVASGWAYMARGATAVTTRGDILYHDGSTVQRLAIGATDDVMTVDASGVPAWRVRQGEPLKRAWAGSGGQFAGGTVTNGNWNNGLKKGGARYGNNHTSTDFGAIMADRRCVRMWGRGQNSALADARTDDHYLGFANIAVQSDALAPDEYICGITGSSYASVFWTSAGKVYVCGYNPQGHQGFGDGSNRPFFRQITFFDGTAGKKAQKAALCSNTYWNNMALFVLTDDGAMYACGYNGHGQLGDGTSTNRSSFVRCGAFTGVIDFDVAVGSTHSVYAWKADGTLYAWGYNGYGELGTGDTTSRAAPFQVPLTDIKYVRAAASNMYNGTNWGSEYYSVLALRNDGTVWGAGYNGSGALGDGTSTNRSTFVQASGLSNVRDIYVANTAYAFTFAITNAGVAYCWGRNNNNQLWQSDSNDRTAPVLYGASMANASDWAEFFPHALIRQGVVIGRKLNGDWFTSGYSTHGLGGTWFGGSSISALPSWKLLNIVDVTMNQWDSSESGNTFYLLGKDGALYAAGYNNYNIGSAVGSQTNNSGIVPVHF